MSETEFRLQLREIRDVTKWVFRAAGIPAGYRLAAQELVAYAELHHRDGLRHLAAQLPILQAKQQYPLILKDETPGHAEFDCGNQPLLLVGPSLTDFGIGEAAARGRYHLTATACQGWPAGALALADQVASRGYACQIHHNEVQIQAIPQGTSVTIRQRRLRLPLPEDNLMIWCGDVVDLGAGDLVYALDATARAAREQTARREGLLVDGAIYKIVKAFANRVLVPLPKEKG